MANIKSAKKRILVNQTKAARNKSIRSAVKTSMKKVEAAVAANEMRFLRSARLLRKAFITRTTLQEKFPA